MVLSENQSSLKPRLVSIIIPTFNRMGFLKDAIGSCLAQTWLQTEVIVVDDGSTDGTVEYLEGLSKMLPEERFRFIVQENHGPSAARNRGLEVARGYYVKFLDSDDSIDTDAIEHYVSAIEKYGTELCIGARRYMSPEGRKWRVNYSPPAGLIQDPLKKFFELTLKPQSPFWFYKRSSFDSMKWNEKLLAREDTYLLACFFISGMSACGAPEAINNQRYHAQGRQSEKQFLPSVLPSI